MSTKNSIRVKSTDLKKTTQNADPPKRNHSPNFLFAGIRPWLTWQGSLNERLEKEIGSFEWERECPSRCKPPRHRLSDMLMGEDFMKCGSITEKDDLEESGNLWISDVFKKKNEKEEVARGRGSVGEKKAEIGGREGSRDLGDWGQSNLSLNSVKSREMSFDRISMGPVGGKKFYRQDGVDGLHRFGSKNEEIEAGSFERSELKAATEKKDLGSVNLNFLNALNQNFKIGRSFGSKFFEMSDEREDTESQREEKKGKVSIEKGLEKISGAEETCHELGSISASTEAHHSISEIGINSIKKLFRPGTGKLTKNLTARVRTLEDEISGVEGETSERLARLFLKFRKDLGRDSKIPLGEKRLLEISLKILFDFEVDESEIEGLRVEHQEMVRSFMRERFFKKKAPELGNRKRGKRGRKRCSSRKGKSSSGLGRGVRGLKRVKESEKGKSLICGSKNYVIGRDNLKLNLFGFVREHLDLSILSEKRNLLANHDASAMKKETKKVLKIKRKNSKINCSERKNNLEKKEKVDLVSNTPRNLEKLGIKEALYGSLVSSRSPSFLSVKKAPGPVQQKLLKKRSFFRFSSDSVQVELPLIESQMTKTSPFLLKTAQKFLKMKAAIGLLSETLPTDWNRGKRNDEKIKKIFKKGMKKLLTNFRESFPGPKLTAVKYEEKFYQHYFGHLPDRLSTFYDPLKKRVKNPRFRSISNDYLDHLKRSELFRTEMRAYCLGEMVYDSLARYPALLMKRYRESSNFLEGQYRAKSKFEWARHEMAAAVVLFLETFDR